MSRDNKKVTDQEALDFHKNGKPGKISILPTKPLVTQRDLSLAYSPGVAIPCLEIQKNPDKAYEYTAKGNFVAVISNGTAVLGLGDLGALASKPVMEGKSVLFKRFADIDSIDLEVDTKDPEAFINAIRYLGPSWGGINLEDIKAPECFIIEDRLRELMDIPVFHDDQHGTAIITLAGLINAASLTGRKFSDIKMVVNGAGAAGIACIELIKAYGVKHENITLCDTNGAIYKGRTTGMNQWKEKHAVDTKARTLEEAVTGADVFLGLSVKGALTKEMVKSMAPRPIIFAMANPDPEITPEEVKSVRDDAIIATGRSDYNNQVNNVMGFPYIFRGALDVKASTINDEMKIAAAESLANLAKESVPSEVCSAYSGRKMQYGPEYIIPVPFDPRLITTVPVAVAKAAMKSGVAKAPITDMDAYVRELGARLNPTSNMMELIVERVAQNPKRVIFAEGEEEQVIRAAILWRDNNYGTPILIGKEKRILETLKSISSDVSLDGIEIHNASLSKKLDEYSALIYKKLQRKGFLYRDCTRLVKNDRNVFASCMLECGDGDVLVTGLTRGYHNCLNDVLKVIDLKPQTTLCGISIMIAKNRTFFISDTAVNELPSADEIVSISTQTANIAKNMGYKPRVALLSYSNFGNPMREKSNRLREAVAKLDLLKPDFEYDGDMSADAALNEEVMKLFPFCKLSATANVLIMPGLHSANISSKLLEELGNGSLIGPILSGVSKPVQIVQMGSNASDIVNLAAFGAIDAIINDEARK
ncbi:NADP-dependent malic enzyme [Candidatus Arcanobacter lacustris]|uniref:NADP-dependent malic enzyme n=1 Tax=Candidatus Arcanibacter lacustris TaxID=1607817 RepID=A0A0F5MPG8_9RICK|nr:NADP-dependent malic enzyme [Candidatus Arcanobacter lacustris]